MNKMIKFQSATFWTDDTGILYCELNNENPGNKLEYAMVQSYIDAIITLSNGKPMPFLIDLRAARGTFSIAAAKLLAKDSKLVKLRVSEAFVTNAIGIKLLIYSYKRLYDPVTPYGIFNNVEDAKEFCNAHKREFHGSI